MGLMACPVAANADVTLVISTNSGTKAEFYLKDDPVITYQDNLLVVKSEMSAISEIALNADDVLECTFRNSDATDIKGLQDGKGSNLSNLEPGTKVQVFSVGGQLMNSTTVSADGSANLNLNTLPQGVYIIKTPKTTFKITNK